MVLPILMEIKQKIKKVIAILIALISNKTKRNKLGILKEKERKNNMQLNDFYRLKNQSIK